MADTIPKLVSAVKSSIQTGDESSQLTLIEATERFISPSLSLVTTTKNASSFIGDPNTSRHLSQCCQKLAVELVELRTSLDRMKADSGVSHPAKQMETAGHKIREAKEEIVACRKAAARNELRLLPGDTPENAIQRFEFYINYRKTSNELVISATPPATKLSVI